MKTKLLTLIFIISTTALFAQSQIEKTTVIQQKLVSENTIYQLFPTKNLWTFIKLDTRNGKMWQVHFSVKDNGGQGEVLLNSFSLVNDEKETNGRFTLYPTENMYNFLLLDQTNGNVYQAQWSMEEKYRGVFKIK